ncbi:unnamed protein product [marine sediment metagenome]|uniref:Uncharacterized protein n=1 Tax=marine sediment metagenome TaxID=412755 RepID=X1EHX9_9ZZZZ
MTIEIRVERIVKLVGKIRVYDKLVTEDSLEPTTVNDMQGNVKDLCDEIKAEADQIKNEVDQWS